MVCLCDKLHRGIGLFTPGVLRFRRCAPITLKWLVQVRCQICPAHRLNTLDLDRRLYDGIMYRVKVKVLRGLAADRC